MVLCLETPAAGPSAPTTSHSHTTAAGPSVYYTVLSISTSMERTIRYYLVESSDYQHINRIWDWCQNSPHDIFMYKTRITKGSTGWVIECPTDSTQTVFLLTWAHLVTHINPPLYAST